MLLRSYLQVITGKGNDTYQIEGDKNEFFDDREECREALQYVDQLHRAGIDTSEFPWRYVSSKSLVTRSSFMSLDLSPDYWAISKTFLQSLFIKKEPQHYWGKIQRNHNLLTFRTWIPDIVLATHDSTCRFYESFSYTDFVAGNFHLTWKLPIYCLVLFIVTGYQKATDFDLGKIVEFINWRATPDSQFKERVLF